MDVTDRHRVRHRRDDLGDLVDRLFPRQRGRKDDDEDEEEEEETETPKKTPKKTGSRTTARTTRYNTLEPTFTGSIAGYSTRRQKETTTTKAAPKSTSTSASITAAQTTAASETQPAAESAAVSSGGMSDGAKAGVAIGAVAGVLALVGLVFFLFARRRRQKGGLDNEKMQGGCGPGPGGYAAARAPGAFGASGNHAHVSSTSSAPAPPAVGSLRNEPRSPGSAWERPMTSGSQGAANPFGAHAEVPGSRPSTPPSNGHAAVGAAMAGGIGAMAGAAATRGVQRRASRQGRGQLDLTVQPGSPMPAVPPSPARTEYSVSSVPSGQPAPVTAGATAIAAAGGPPGSAVHRVQLDFEPTLEDELGLKAGQLVRVLHEYDDGWALCIRLDRSKQGVVPRTCLSTRPVKPRGGSQNRGPPVRPTTPKASPPPQNPASRPTTPGTSPGPRYQPMPPRVSPAPSRVMSPAPGPLSAPMAGSSAASVVSSLSPSSREPSPRSVEMPPEMPVVRRSPALSVEFTTLPAPVAAGPIGGAGGPDASRRKPVPGQV